MCQQLAGVLGHGDGQGIDLQFLGGAGDLLAHHGHPGGVFRRNGDQIGPVLQRPVDVAGLGLFQAQVIAGLGVERGLVANGPENRRRVVRDLHLAGQNQGLGIGNFHVGSAVGDLARAGEGVQGFGEAFHGNVAAAEQQPALDIVRVFLQPFGQAVDHGGHFGIGFRARRGLYRRLCGGQVAGGEGLIRLVGRSQDDVEGRRRQRHAGADQHGGQAARAAAAGEACPGL